MDHQIDILASNIKQRVRAMYYADLIEELLEKTPDIYAIAGSNVRSIAMAMNSSKYLLSVVDRDGEPSGTFAVVNQAWMDLSGKDFHYLTSTPFLEMVDEVDKNRTLKAWNGMLDDEIEEANGFVNHYWGNPIKWFPYASVQDKQYFICVAEAI